MNASGYILPKGLECSARSCKLEKTIPGAFGPRKFINMPKISYDRVKILLLSAVVLVAIFFRFWMIRDYMVFLGDEGRDMIVIRDIFVKHHIPFLGPTASVGGFYLGPIYYWMAAPFLLLSGFDPVGPSYMVATVGFL